IGSYQFHPVRISKKIPPIKILKLKDSDSPIHFNEDWYIFEPHGGTSEEKHFVELINGYMEELLSIYADVKLMRNEKAFNIFSFDKKRDGARFEPDFILLLKDKKGCYHQIFCEPKGDWAKDENDGFNNSSEKWKNQFLSDITKCTDSQCLKLENINEGGLALYENSCYKILGLPFYNYAMESEFKGEFKNLILK
ncbi:MAG: hypothetical protein J7L21_03945, partial [Sulfurimonas sp.]|nr:hypothetical protein [Sulfurimonas sp.]